MTQEMKRYVITRTVKAMPFTDIVHYEGNPEGKPHDSEAYEPGYLIEYDDGHQVWCPAETFEKDSKLIETALDRLRIEYSELRERCIKLDRELSVGFNETAKRVGAKHAALLGAQNVFMENYLQILEARIADMEENGDEQ